VVEMIRDSDTYSHVCRSDDDNPYVFTALELNNEQTQVEPEFIKEDMLGKIGWISSTVL
jgi:predicted nicotinamide N-methyase